MIYSASDCCRRTYHDHAEGIWIILALHDILLVKLEHRRTRHESLTAKSYFTDVLSLLLVSGLREPWG